MPKAGQAEHRREEARKPWRAKDRDGTAAGSSKLRVPYKLCNSRPSLRFLFFLFVFFGCCVCAAAKCKKRVPKKIAQSTKASGFHSMIHNIGPYPVSKRALNYLVIFDGYLR